MIEKVFSFLQHKKLFLTALLLFNAALHISFLKEPPCSSHVWRQCNTLAVTRNFCEEGMDILKPRVDRRLDTDGVTGMQFPAYEYVAAAICNVTGYREWVIRLYSLLLFSLGVLFFYGICHRIFQSHLAGALGAWSLCWCPELFYHSINALPDILALTLMLGGLYYFLKWNSCRQLPTLIVSMLLITLAGLTKMQFTSVLAFTGTAMLVGVWKDRKTRSASAFQFVAATVIPTLIVFAWYIYANKLIASSGLADFGITISQQETLAETADILFQNIVSNAPGLLLNYVTFFLVLAGLYFLSSNKPFRNPWFLPLLAWTFLLAVFHLAEIHQMRHHNYYMIVHIPVLLITAVYGCLQFRRNQKFSALLLLLCLAQPVLATVRILPARWLNTDKGIPAPFYNRETRAKLEAAIPPNELCVVGPDPSGCIYFYFLNAKGFGFDHMDDLKKRLPDGSIVLADYIRRGARYLVTDQPEMAGDSTLLPFFGKRINLPGNFYRVELIQAIP